MSEQTTWTNEHDVAAEKASGETQVRVETIRSERHKVVAAIWAGALLLLALMLFVFLDNHANDAKRLDVLERMEEWQEGYRSGKSLADALAKDVGR